MGARFRRGGLAVVLAVTGLLACQPEKASAHPLLAGRWMTPTPPEGFLAFDFQPGRHGGNGVWYGCYSYNVSNYSVIYGTYELRMFSRDEGTLSPLPNRENQGFNVGDINLRTRVLELGGTQYRHVAP